jgi:hypothetical protein
MSHENLLQRVRLVDFVLNSSNSEGGTFKAECWGSKLVIVNITKCSLTHINMSLLSPRQKPSLEGPTTLS